MSSSTIPTGRKRRRAPTPVPEQVYTDIEQRDMWWRAVTGRRTVCPRDKATLIWRDCIAIDRGDPQRTQHVFREHPPTGWILREATMTCPSCNRSTMLEPTGDR